LPLVIIFKTFWRPESLPYFKSHTKKFWPFKFIMNVPGNLPQIRQVPYFLSTRFTSLANTENKNIWDMRLARQMPANKALLALIGLLLGLAQFFQRSFHAFFHGIVHLDIPGVDLGRQQ
jgi:hypothetical protein